MKRKLAAVAAAFTLAVGGALLVAAPASAVPSCVSVSITNVSYGLSADYTGTAAGAAGSFADAVQNVSEHVATGGEDCRYCPVCQAIHVVRQTSPEVRAHLAVAASSLMHAAAGLLATNTPGQQKSPSVEKIDLDGGAPWDEDQ